jgi:hypothetical protein
MNTNKNTNKNTSKDKTSHVSHSKKRIGTAVDALADVLKQLLRTYNRLSKKRAADVRRRCASRVVTWCVLVKATLVSGGTEADMDTIRLCRNMLNSCMLAELRNQAPLAVVQDFGSTNPWSDVDYQVSFSLPSITEPGFHRLCDAIDDVRSRVAHLPKAVCKGFDRISADNFIEVNWYLPTLLFRTSKQQSNNKKTRGNRYFAECPSSVTCLVPQLRSPEEQFRFLVADCVAALSRQRTQLRTCYARYRTLWPVLRLLKQLISPSAQVWLSDNEFNTVLFRLVRANPTCADMYFSIGAIIFVVVFLQVCGGNVKKCPLRRKTLSALAISSALENTLMFARTRKQKYQHRVEMSLTCIEDFGLAKTVIETALKQRVLRAKRDQHACKHLLSRL